MSALERIKGYETVVARCGEWPSFHDSEIRRVELDRSGPTATFDISVVWAREWFDVAFRFDQVDEFELAWFNHQNVISSIAIEERESRLVIEIESRFGAECQFSCSGAEVFLR